MNKRFSTLLAAALVATSVSVNAQSTASGEYKSGDSYLLGNGANFITVTGDRTNGYALKFTTSTDLKSLTEINNALWTVEVEEGNLGAAPKFTFVNKATGLPFAFDLSKAVEHGQSLPTGYQLELDGGFSNDWYNGLNVHDIQTDSPLITYYKAEDDSIAFIHQAGDGSIVLLKGKTEDLNVAFKVRPYNADAVVLTAEDLNTNLRTNEDVDGWFTLAFDPDVTDNATANPKNIFTATELKAVQSGTVNVQLMAKDKKAQNPTTKKDEQAYIVVDTSYISGTENDGKLIAFTYATLEGNRHDESYNFKFTYYPSNDSLTIKASEYYIKSEDADDKGSFWNTTLIKYGNDGDTEGMSSLPGRWVRLAKLTAVSELTLGREEQVNTRISANLSASKYIPTTLESGLYMIKYINNKPKETALNGAYKIARLNGQFVYEQEERNEMFEHLPAAQWVVEKQGTSTTAPVEIYNREFQDLNTNLNGQLYKVEGSDAVFFYGADMDTLQFIPVDAEIAKDKYLGYKHISDDDSKARVYSFNYLHGLSMDTYLNVPEGKDSIVRVDEKGGKAWFQLEKVIKEDSYGYQTTGNKFANLVRDVYYIKVRDAQKLDKDNLYLTYDKALNKYVTTSTGAKTPFFLKENNEVDTCYYVLIPANVDTEYNKDGKELGLIVTDREYYSDASATVVNSMSDDYASSKASVDDNTLDLTQNSIDNNTEEVRVSAFAIAANESPLYRRFNVEDLGENANDDPNIMKFYRVNATEKEYLYEDFNSKYSAGKNTGFLGVEGKGDKAKAAMYVDTAYVNRNTLMPQYLIAVGPSIVKGDTTLCDVCGELTCEHSKVTRGYTEGRYLINLVDSVKKYANTDNADTKQKRDPLWFPFLLHPIL